MEFPMLKRVKDLKEQLGPIFEELGIQPMISMGWAREPIIEFKGPGGRVSPITLNFSDRKWDGSWFVVFNMVSYPIGDTGWTCSYFDGVADEVEYECYGTTRRFLKGLGEALLEEGVLVTAEGNPTVTESSIFADALKTIKELFPTSIVECGRIGSAEHYDISTKDGIALRLAFDDGRVTLYEGETACGAVDRFDDDGVKTLLADWQQLRFGNIGPDCNGAAKEALHEATSGTILKI